MTTPQGPTPTPDPAARASSQSNAPGAASSDTPSCRPPCPDAAKGVTCQECAEFLLDYIDGLLPEDQRFKFDSHVAFCRDCEVYLDNYRKAAALTTGLSRDDRLRAGGHVPKGLVEAILKARKGLSPPPPHSPKHPSKP